MKANLQSRIESNNKSVKYLLRISPLLSERLCLFGKNLVCGTNNVCGTHNWTNTPRTEAQLPSGHLSDLSSSTVLHFVSLNTTQATEITYFLYNFFHLISVCLYVCIPYCYQYLLSPTFNIDWLQSINCPSDLLKKDQLPVHRNSLVVFHIIYAQIHVNELSSDIGFIVTL